jgi:hypothetical protein
MKRVTILTVLAVAILVTVVTRAECCRPGIEIVVKDIQQEGELQPIFVKVTGLTSPAWVYVYFKPYGGKEYLLWGQCIGNGLYKIAQKKWPLGTHHLRVSVVDKCGRVLAEAKTSFYVQQLLPRQSLTYAPASPYTCPSYKLQCCTLTSVFFLFLLITVSCCH